MRAVSRHAGQCRTYIKRKKYMYEAMAVQSMGCVRLGHGLGQHNTELAATRIAWVKSRLIHLSQQ
jgi:hypothetical protein